MPHEPSANAGVAVAMTSAAELLVATGHDPFLRSSLRHTSVRGWLGGGAAAWMEMDDYDNEPYLMMLGEPSRAAALLADLLPELAPGQGVTLPRGTGALLPAWVGLSGTDWDFRWTDRPPPRQAGEERVVSLSDDGGVAALLAASSPRAAVLPGSPRVRGWVGVRGGSRELIACAADTSVVPGIGHLSSIAVSPAVRGQGLGRAVTAALTRRLLEQGCELVTLGMYADNTAGRALYDALGYADEHRLSSGTLVVRSRW